MLSSSSSSRACLNITCFEIIEIKFFYLRVHYSDDSLSGIFGFPWNSALRKVCPVKEKYGYQQLRFSAAVKVFLCQCIWLKAK